MERSEKWRLFVAFALPESVKTALEAVQAELASAVSRESVRWTRPDQLHLTLKFLGNVEPNLVPALTEAVARVCHGFQPLRLRVQGIGFFPSIGPPRVAWAGADDANGNLTELQAALEMAVGDFTHERSEGSFTGHITLGRIRKLHRSQVASVFDTAERMQKRFFGEWTADGIELIRSEPTSTGSSHSTIAVVGFANGSESFA